MGVCGSASTVGHKNTLVAAQSNQQVCQYALQQVPYVQCGHAQTSKPVLIPGLFTQEYIDSIKALSDELSSSSRIKTHSKRAWKTRYLHVGGAFRRALPHLLEKMMNAAKTADASEGGMSLLHGLRDPTRLKPRCIEHHIIAPGGALPDTYHFDEGSLLTIDIMLSDPQTDFEGGAFRTLEDVGVFETHPFGKGDAIVFVSHKYHCVNYVTSGLRQVLIMELWEGTERTCDHRCDLHWGKCDVEEQAVGIELPAK